MRPSRNGTLFVLCREALVTVAYPDDSTGGGRCSAGAGHNSADLKPGQEVKLKQAFDWLRDDLAERARNVNTALKVPVKQYEFDAILSMYFRRGTDPLLAITEHVNAGRWWDAVIEFPKWGTNQAGERKDGLLKRCMREGTLFATGEYGDLRQIPFFRGDPLKTPREIYVIQEGDL